MVSRLCLVALATLLQLADGAFAPQPAARAQCAPRRTNAVQCSGGGADGALGRRAVIAGGALAGGAVGALGVPGIAWAGYVTNLGLGGDVTSAADADIDEELLRSSKVQASVKNLKQYKANAGAMKKAFERETNMPLIPSIRKYFDFSDLRNDLNIAGTVFDDQTQLTTDRLARAILYDLTELENASRFKKGEEAVRTPKKVANVEKWFEKLDNDFGVLLAYFPAVRLPPPPPPPAEEAA